ncbi:MAG: hypothetical protein KHZ01_05335 [Lachnospiraceae bacterium]|nr:hypothetical protein [Lachnospiraceae bacterium]
MIKTTMEIRDCGTLEVSDIIFDTDSIRVFMDFLDISSELISNVAEAIEKSKIEYSKNMKEYNREFGRNHPINWSNAPVVICFCGLLVTLKNHSINYSINVGYEDAKNPFMENFDCEFDIDLSKYEPEIKKTILKILIDKFF